MDKTFIPYARQSIEADDIEAVLGALKSDWLTTGPEIPKFEKELADTCGARFAVVCANGTAALHLAALALGLKSGESVVTTPITFLATANAARYVGADVIFSDVNAETINLDPERLGDLLKRSSKKIKAIFPVHFAGQPAEMEEIYRLSKDYGLSIVEDASHALGASYRTDAGEKVRVGSCRHSDLTVFSFHPVKHITSGEGGAITTNDERLYERLKVLRNHGMISNPSEGPWFYEMREVGMNYRLTDIQCALGRNQLKKLETFLARRKRVAEIYREGFKPFVDFIRPVQVLPGFDGDVRHAYHLFPVRIDFRRLGISRSDVMMRLKGAGIGTQVHYIPVHLQPYYRNLYGTKKGDFPNAEAYYEEALSLPMYSSISDEDLQRVLAATAEIFSDRGVGGDRREDPPSARRRMAEGNLLSTGPTPVSKKISIIVQARMGASRLPGKIMKTVLGKPMLEYQWERLKRVKLADEVVIATTKDRSDNVVIDLCQKLSAPFFRGDAADVLGRYYEAAKKSGSEIIVRITGDCPLIDPVVIDRLIEYYLSNKNRFDYVSNVMERTFPRGMDVEVFPFKILEEIHALATDPSDREHVTLYIRRNPKEYRLGNLSYLRDESRYRWTLDTEDDLRLIREFIEQLYPINPHFSLEDCLRLIEQKPDLIQLNQHVRQKEV